MNTGTESYKSIKHTKKHEVGLVEKCLWKEETAEEVSVVTLAGLVSN